MDVSAIDIFWVVIAFIRVVLLIASFERKTTNRVGPRHFDCSNPTNFDIMSETKR